MIPVHFVSLNPFVLIVGGVEHNYTLEHLSTYMASCKQAIDEVSVSVLINDEVVNQKVASFLETFQAMDLCNYKVHLGYPCQVVFPKSSDMIDLKNVSGPYSFPHEEIVLENVTFCEQLGNAKHVNISTPLKHVTRSMIKTCFPQVQSFSIKGHFRFEESNGYFTTFTDVFDLYTLFHSSRLLGISLLFLGRRRAL